MAELMLLVGGPVPPWASHHFESLQLSGGGAFASLHEDKNLTSTHASVERRPPAGSQCYECPTDAPLQPLMSLQAAVRGAGQL